MLINKISCPYGLLASTQNGKKLMDYFVSEYNDNVVFYYIRFQKLFLVFLKTDLSRNKNTVCHVFIYFIVCNTFQVHVCPFKPYYKLL